MAKKTRQDAQGPGSQSKETKDFLVWLDDELKELSPRELRRGPWPPRYESVADEAYNRSMPICLKLGIDVQPPPRIDILYGDDDQLIAQRKIILRWLRKLRDAIVAGPQTDKFSLRLRKLRDAIAAGPQAPNSYIPAKEDLAILSAMVVISDNGKERMTQTEIEAHSGVSRRTISLRLNKCMRPAGLVSHPAGKSKLECITDKGRVVLDLVDA